VPELPEVQTTVNGINKYVKGLRIVDVWTDYASPNYKGKNQIKNKEFFKTFSKSVVGGVILKAERRAKNILIHLSNKKTVLIHMKMTGHILYEKYEKTRSKKDPWKPRSENKNLSDPFNRFIHFVLSLSNGKHLVLSDMRKFAKVTVMETDTLSASEDLAHLGPEPLTQTFTASVMHERLLRRPNKVIKSALMDQSLISGIGNIYSDEILFASNIHPLTPVSHLSTSTIRNIWKHTKNILQKGIHFSGDSTSDYRTIEGKRGNFQYHHQAYRQTGTPCPKPRCKGTIKRIVIGGRGTHFCSLHQKLL
jgi:formamidopyrimidine-DNA glycosylase